MNFTPARPLGEPLRDALTASLAAPAMARSVLAATLRALLMADLDGGRLQRRGILVPAGTG